MLNIKENTTLVGISELRTKFNKVMEVLGKSKVLLEKRHKPLAVIMPIEKYNQMEELVDLIEDTYLVSVAKHRYLKSKPSDYLDLEVAEDKLKKK